MDLGEQDLHIWPVPLTASDAAIAAFERMLSPEEAHRCQRFHFQQHRRSYTISHGVLRALLGRYLKTSPEKIDFRYERAGKPALAIPATNLTFNMAHSGEFAVYAFARNCRVGIDVERVRPLADLETIATRFFSPEECSQVLELDTAERVLAFFRCWTRKEAYIKAVGDGLSMPLDRFQVSLAASAPAAVVRPAEGQVGPWRMHHFEPHEEYIGAVAYDGAVRRIYTWPLTGFDRVHQQHDSPAAFPS